MPMDRIDKMFLDLPGEDKVLIDLKGIFDRKKLPAGYRYWRL
jgi:hypothetical protein